ncbi:hypothetical protein LR010_01550 [Candidatus Gracilibacteria bacterium]|nr:hypothetical protein [Candidatus Gracilibacteria bacterium]
MNTKLEKLFVLNDFSVKDRHDFMQIYSLLPNYKKVRVIENFDEILKRVGDLKSEILMEQEILFGNTLKNIEERLKTMQKDKINMGSRESIALLKNII